MTKPIRDHCDDCGALVIAWRLGTLASARRWRGGAVREVRRAGGSDAAMKEWTVMDVTRGGTTYEIGAAKVLRAGGCLRFVDRDGNDVASIPVGEIVSVVKVTRKQLWQQ